MWLHRLGGRLVVDVVPHRLNAGQDFLLVSGERHSDPLKISGKNTEILYYNTATIKGAMCRFLTPINHHRINHEGSLNWNKKRCRYSELAQREQAAYTGMG